MTSPFFSSNWHIIKYYYYYSIEKQVISAEFEHGKGSHDDLRSYMESQGYIAETVVTAPQNLANDYIFVKKELLKISWKHQQ